MNTYETLHELLLTERVLGVRLGRIDALADASRVLRDLIDADPDNASLREARRRIEVLSGGLFEGSDHG